MSQPNDTGGAEDCAAMIVAVGLDGGKWKDLQCDDSSVNLAFICEVSE
jgi:hypothetical protein